MSVSSSTSGPSSSASEATVSLRRHGDAAVLRVTGEIDMATSGRLTEAVTDALRGKPQVLVVDLGGVTFFASAGVSALVAAWEASGDQTRFAVVVTGNAVLRSLKLSGADFGLALHGSVDEALAAR